MKQGIQQALLSVGLADIPSSIREKKKDSTEEWYLVCPAVYSSIIHISQMQLLPRSAVFQNTLSAVG